MSFVPVTPPPTTPRARELAREIVKTVEDFRSREHRTTDQDVERALMLAKGRLGGQRPMLVMIAAGIVLLLAGILFFLRMNGG